LSLDTRPYPPGGGGEGSNMRVRITKNHKSYKKGRVVDVSRNVAFGLIDSGIAVVSKDMTESDSTTKEFKGGRVIK
jgi:hypothetical protein